jgi:hypothetical protein
VTFEEIIEQQIKGIERSDGAHKYWIARAMCSEANLINFEFENDAIALTYQTTKLGTVSYGSDHEIKAFSIEDSGEKEQVIIYINKDNKAYNLHKEDLEDEVSYLYPLFELKNYIFPTPLHLTKEYYLDKKLIKQIETQASLVCKLNTFENF